ncbi:MAG: hypothetical protein IV100_29175 [Myxococcales bacterium]|nr:hypothetical protein [Myxococcales bacterium]
MSFNWQIRGVAIVVVLLAASCAAQTFVSCQANCSSGFGGLGSLRWCQCCGNECASRGCW